MKRDLMHKGLGLLALAVLTPAAAWAADEPQQTVSEVISIAPTPLGAGLNRNRIGSTVQSLSADDLARTGTLNLTDALQRYIPGVNVTHTQGNGFTGDLNYRGFGATPLQGQPQGLAVYLNGQRMNEAFGDTVNWDLLPEVAIGGADLVTNNPAFGLNALGGALNLRAKDGFSYRGGETEFQSGSNRYLSTSSQIGLANDTWAFYGALDGGKDDGWRQQSASNVLRGYFDLTRKIADGEIHFTGGTSKSRLGVVGPTPVDLLDADRTSVFTYPQTTDNNAQFFALNFNRKLAGNWSMQGGLHVRRFTQQHVDGNDGDFERCSATGVLANTLCLEDDAFSSLPAAQRPTTADLQLLNTNNQPIACPILVSTATDTNGCRNRISAADGPRIPYGTIDRTWTASTTRGVELAFTNETEFLGMKVNSVFGGSYDDNNIHFSSNSTLGLISPSLEVVSASYPVINVNGAVPGLGQVIHTASNVGYGPAEVDVDSSVGGYYSSTTVDLLENLSVTFGGRYNSVDIRTVDLTGAHPELNAQHKFTRYNPAINLAWRPVEGVTLFGGYSETNRAPTPLELSCSDPAKPCLLENSLVADPPLNQVVSKTTEIGGRGGYDVFGGRLGWSLAAFTTDNDDDIISVASQLAGRGYYLNVPSTRRSGYEGLVSVTYPRWSAYVGYSHIDAEYRSPVTLASPNNPMANAAGNISVVAGDKLGGIPAERVKLGAEASVVAGLSVGIDAQYVGDAWFVGDDGNDNDKLPSYWTANLRADYAVTPKISVFGRVTNLFDEEYATFGTFYEAEAVQKVRPRPLPLSPEETTLTPAAPRSFYVGLRAKF